MTLYFLFLHLGSIGLSLLPSCPLCLLKVQSAAFKVPQVSRQSAWSCRHSCWPLLHQFTRDLLGSGPDFLERETCRPWGQKLVPCARMATTANSTKRNCSMCWRNHTTLGGLQRGRVCITDSQTSLKPHRESREAEGTGWGKLGHFP